MSLLVWKGSLGKPLLRDVLAGSTADMAWPERAPVRAGVAFWEGAAPVGETGAALLMLAFGSVTGVAFARAVPARGAARPCALAFFASFTSCAAPAAPARRGFAAAAFVAAFAVAFVTAFATLAAGARGAT
ncbi:hypothetical protein [Paraburkholderia sp. J63]|uniref:hypothetical protein n=1 Tax=Paraburkholderia sp. J63 TaxID=2805434 RepID=UPI002ABE4C98|nr:hypothetical protein [Paraburkholderia sp. J63]